MIVTAGSQTLSAAVVTPTALTTPAAPAGVASTTGGTLTAGNNFAKIVAVDSHGGTTLPSGEVAAAVVTSGTTASILWTWPLVPNAVSYQIWCSTTTGSEANYFTSTTNSYTQTAAASTGTSGTIPTVNTSGGIVGTTTNDNAGVGVVGEYIAPAVVVSSTVSLTTATSVNVTSLSLTAGDWDVQGGAIFQTAATTSVTQAIAGISTTTNTLGTDGTYSRNTIAAFVPGAVEWLDQVTPIVRISVAATTTVYLVAQSTFTVSTQTAGGYIRARRVR